MGGGEKGNGEIVKVSSRVKIIFFPEANLRLAFGMSYVAYTYANIPYIIFAQSDICAPYLSPVHVGC